MIRTMILVEATHGLLQSFLKGSPSLENLDLEDLAQQRSEEIECLECILGDAFQLDCPQFFQLCIRPITAFFSADIQPKKTPSVLPKDEADALSEGTCVSLHVCLPLAYPQAMPVLQVGDRYRCLKDEQYSALVHLLNSTARSKLAEGDSAIIYEIYLVAQAFVDRILTWSETEATSVLAGGSAYHDVLSKEETTPTTRYEGDPTQYVGTTHELMKKLQQEYGLHVLMIENVLRKDLEAKFKERMRKMGCRATMGFHGTQRTVIGSIVRKGLIVPGQGKSADGRDIGVRCGSAYGKGIYLSPNPNFSLGYSDDSSRLLVCAVLRGRTHVMSSCYGGGLRKGYDSHSSNDGNQFVVFRGDQVLPCFVLHLKKGVTTFTSPTVRSSTMQSIAHLSEKEKRKRLEIRARKHFPFGFGPSDRLVVLEVADSDEDDDLYSYDAAQYIAEAYAAAEYQADRFDDTPFAIDLFSKR